MNNPSCIGILLIHGSHDFNQNLHVIVTILQGKSVIFTFIAWQLDDVLFTILSLRSFRQLKNIISFYLKKVTADKIIYNSQLQFLSYNEQNNIISSGIITTFKNKRNKKLTSRELIIIHCTRQRR